MIDFDFSSSDLLHDSFSTPFGWVVSFSVWRTRRGEDYCSRYYTWLFGFDGGHRKFADCAVNASRLWNGSEELFLYLENEDSRGYSTDGKLTDDKDKFWKFTKQESHFVRAIERQKEKNDRSQENILLGIAYNIGYADSAVIVSDRHRSVVVAPTEGIYYADISHDATSIIIFGEKVAILDNPLVDK